MSNYIRNEALPELEDERNNYERELTHQVQDFQWKVEAQGFQLQDEVKTELSTIQDDLQNEEKKRREYDADLLCDVKMFLDD